MESREVKKLKRALVVMATLAGMAALVPAQAAEAAPRATVGGGSGIVLNGNARCTMTTVGHDRTGQLVGLTAGHCGPLGAPVTSERTPKAGVIGRVMAASPRMDVAVINLDQARVRPVRQVGKARIYKVGSYPRPHSNVCKQGRSTGFTCGPTLLFQGDATLNYVCSNHGDSGGPIISRGRVVGMLNGALRVAGPGTPSIACTNRNVPLHSPMIATKMTDILKTLNRVDTPGNGFRPI